MRAREVSTTNWSFSSTKNHSSVQVCKEIPKTQTEELFLMDNTGMVNKEKKRKEPNIRSIKAWISGGTVKVSASY